MRSWVVILLFSVSLATADENFTYTPKDHYIFNEVNGVSYKLVYNAAEWNFARLQCSSEGSKLAVPNSMEEFHFIQKMVRRMFYPWIVGAKYRGVVWVGVSNQENYTVWRTVDGVDINQTGFYEWAKGNGQDPRPDPKEPHCAGIDATNPGYRQHWCHYPQPYICQLKALHY